MQKARQLTRSARTASKSTLDELTQVGRTRLGELGRSARQSAAVQRLVPAAAASRPELRPEPAHPVGQHGGPVKHDTLGPATETAGAGASRRFLSNVSSELNGLAQQTSSLLSNVFGKAR